MKLNLYQIDAFSNRIFSGNPACVVPLDKWPDDFTLLNIAKENAVAETAFFVINSGLIHLRWFTPEIEMDLCGHATLATAHCLRSILHFPDDRFIFQTLSGELEVSINDNMYQLDFPARIPVPAALPENIRDALNLQPKEVFKSRDYVLVYENETEVRNIKINRQFFDQLNLDPGGVIVTAQGDSSDFVSRFFTPQASILEDPVTGSAHCSLIPFWAEKLGKNELYARQVSERGGELFCENKGKRVLISGHAKTYSVGTLWTE